MSKVLKPPNCACRKCLSRTIFGCKFVRSRVWICSLVLECSIYYEGSDLIKLYCVSSSFPSRQARDNTIDMSCPAGLAGVSRDHVSCSFHLTSVFNRVKWNFSAAVGFSCDTPTETDPLRGFVHPHSVVLHSPRSLRTRIINLSWFN